MRGFATVATGNENYYRLAYNLCLSYKKRGKGKYPFCLICDRKNEYTDIFDDVVLVSEYRKSTLDKLLMRYSPYDETIFMDADILIINPIDALWDIFADCGDVSAFGCKLQLNSKKGWFTYEGSGKYKPRIHYLISMNGGIYYIKKGSIADSVFRDTEDVIREYSNIDFKYFKTPMDEPVMAMAMVLNECIPCEKSFEMAILPAYSRRITVDYKGNLFSEHEALDTVLIHFSNPRTRLFLYNYLDTVNKKEYISKTDYYRMYIEYLPRDLWFAARHKCGGVLRIFGLGSTVDWLKKYIH